MSLLKILVLLICVISIESGTVDKIREMICPHASNSGNDMNLQLEKCQAMAKKCSCG